VVKTPNDKKEDKNEEKQIKKEVELKNLLPFSSISLMDKSEDESEDEMTESDEDEIHELLNGFFGHFYQNYFPSRKVNLCKSFYIKLKKAYGCTKKDSVIELSGWKCCFKK
jgi:hypothetical protein